MKKDLKKRANHRKYLKILKSMSSEKRLDKAFELSKMARDLFIYGLRKKYAILDEQEFKKVLFKKLEKCHNRNY